MKNNIFISVLFFLLLLFIEDGMAGWGGAMRCSSCSYRSDVLHAGQGKATSCAVIRCFNCRGCFQLLVDYNEDSIRHAFADPDRELAELKKKKAVRIGREMDPELKVEVNLYACPKCGKKAREVPEDVLLKMRAIQDEKGSCRASSFIKCPCCGHGSLFIENTLKWD